MALRQMLAQVAPTPPREGLEETGGRQVAVVAEIPTPPRVLELQLGEMVETHTLVTLEELQGR